jgi:hypothetical protein
MPDRKVFPPNFHSILGSNCHLLSFGIEIGCNEGHMVVALLIEDL